MFTATRLLKIHFLYKTYAFKWYKRPEGTTPVTSKYRLMLYFSDCSSCPVLKQWHLFLQETSNSKLVEFSFPLSFCVVGPEAFSNVEQGAVQIGLLSFSPK